MENVATSTETKALLEPLYKNKGWMMFAGVMSIVGGALQALSIWGLLFAWLPIWMGILLYQAASSIKKAYEENQNQEIPLALAKLGSYFKIMGIFTIVMVILALIAVIVAIALPGMLKTKTLNPSL